MTVTCATVIATRNRPEVLALSLPLHLAQSRLPERIVIVDSSDDMTANRALVHRHSQESPVPIDHVPSAAGLPLQRNVGLTHITSDVVFFPDDDSLVHPGAMAAILAIYDRDPECRIGGVCGLEVNHAPAGTLAPVAAVSARRPSPLHHRLTRWRLGLERRRFPDPMKLAALRLYERIDPPEAWLGQMNAVRVEWMTGFRMSFRTHAVRQIGFNERMGRYALYEDVDMGLQVLSRGQSLVAALDAQVYHHRAPENRTAGRQMGAINILNRAYVVMRSGVADPRIKAAVRRYSWFRTMQFLSGRRSAFGRERHLGALAASRLLPELLSAPPERLDDVYSDLCARCFPYER